MSVCKHTKAGQRDREFHCEGTFRCKTSTHISSQGLGRPEDQVFRLIPKCAQRRGWTPGPWITKLSRYCKAIAPQRSEWVRLNPLVEWNNEIWCLFFVRLVSSKLFVQHKQLTVPYHANLFSACLSVLVGVVFVCVGACGWVWTMFMCVFLCVLHVYVGW